MKKKLENACAKKEPVRIAKHKRLFSKLNRLMTVYRKQIRVSSQF